MRIVSLLSSATEMLFALGIGNQVLAISHECDYPPEATKLPRATRSIVDSTRPSHEIDVQVKRLLSAGEALYEIDRDLIRQLQPDLIVTQAQCDVCAVRYQDVVDFVAAEPSLVLAKIVALNPQSVENILDDVLAVGRAARCAAAASRLKDRLSGRYARIIDTARRDGDTAQRPRVVVIEWTDPLMTAGNWTPELIAAAGGDSLLAESRQHSDYVAWSDIVAARPDVLIVAPCGFNLERSLREAQRLIDLPGFCELPAVVQERAYVIDGNAYLNRSGPRIIDSLEILAHLIRPDRFEAPAGELAEGRAWLRLSPRPQTALAR
jgi:iron complex transport system substrate-binding protein